MVATVHPIVALMLWILDIISLVLIIWIIFGWLVSFRILNMQTPIVARIYYGLNNLFEPMLRPIRRHMPDLGAVDASPIVLFLGIKFAEYCIIYYFG